MECIAKNDLFLEIVFEEFRNVFLMFSGVFGRCFSEFLGLENKLENRTIFYEIQNPNNPIWWGISAGFWACYVLRRDRDKRTPIPQPRCPSKEGPADLI